MTQRRQATQDRHHKLAIILYRYNRGDSVHSIATHFHNSGAYIYQQLMRANTNIDIKYEAKLMMTSGENQMLFPFMYEPL